MTFASLFLELTQHDKLLLRTARKLLKGKSFEQRDSGIRNLSFLRNCENLQTLDLRCNDIEDLSPIASLHRLKYLTLDFNLITNLSPLADMEQLRELRLYGNKVHSLEPLRELHNLNTLILKGNPLEPGTLSCLRKCKRLGMLDLSYTGIQDLKDLEFCRAWSLTLYGNPNLTGLEVITTMKRLTSLHLDWEVARRYDIPAMMPHFTEYARYGNHVLYVWPEKFFD
ncbi:MAG: leucine-rich repeat domain-containing protein [Lachnospiraceae bacterium]|nr:leucine-rich repeat domain-containing protein [Lachnospiraceae bacterium]